MIGFKGWHWTCLPLLLAALTAFVLINPRISCAASGVSQITLLHNREYGKTLIRGIRSARSSIFCSFYLFKTGAGHKNQPRRVLEELILAKRRGVSVRVILEQNGDRDDDLNEENRHTASLLNSAGIRVRFDSPAITSHGKIVVIDNRFVYIGSHNLTQAALLHNNELSVVIDSPEIARQVISKLGNE